MAHLMDHIPSLPPSYSRTMIGSLQNREPYSHRSESYLGGEYHIDVTHANVSPGSGTLRIGLQVTQDFKLEPAALGTAVSQTYDPADDNDENALTIIVSPTVASNFTSAEVSGYCNARRETLAQAHSSIILALEEWCWQLENGSQSIEKFYRESHDGKWALDFTLVHGNCGARISLTADPDDGPSTTKTAGSRVATLRQEMMGAGTMTDALGRRATAETKTKLRTTSSPTSGESTRKPKRRRPSLDEQSFRSTGGFRISALTPRQPLPRRSSGPSTSTAS